MLIIQRHILTKRFLLFTRIVILLSMFWSPALTMLGDDPVSANREALTSDLVNLATRAQDYYYRSSGIGGGGSFAGLNLSDLTVRPTNANGAYGLTAASAQQVILDASGTERGDDGQPLSVTITVFPDSMYVTNNN